MDQVRKLKHELDIQLIGSDISIRAIDTATKNVEYADLDKYQGIFNIYDRQIINDPMIFGTHWPKTLENNKEVSESNSLINFKETSRRAYLSLYHGDFNKVGQRLQVLTDNFKHFTLLMNVPYGYQSTEKQLMDVRDTQNLYRRLGRFLQTIKTPPVPNGSDFSSREEAINIPDTSDDTLAVTTSSTNEPHVFVVAKSRHYGHELSFEKFSNCGWDTKLHFNNGGLAVNLLQMDY